MHAEKKLLETEARSDYAKLPGTGFFHFRSRFYLCIVNPETQLPVSVS